MTDKTTHHEGMRTHQDLRETRPLWGILGASMVLLGATLSAIVVRGKS